MEAIFTRCSFHRQARRLLGDGAGVLALPESASLSVEKLAL
jgi:hypothetical protein